MNFCFLVGGIKSAPSYKTVNGERKIFFLLAISNEFKNPDIVECSTSLSLITQSIVKKAFPGCLVAIKGKVKSYITKGKKGVSLNAYVDILEINYCTKRLNLEDVETNELSNLFGLNDLVKDMEADKKKKGESSGS